MNRNRSRLTLVMTPIALAFLALGCGKHDDHQMSAASGASQGGVVDQIGEAVDRMSGASRAGEPQAGSAATSADSLPPEVAVSTADTLVVPGAVVEITALGTPDVVEITLSDRLGTKQPFSYDAAAKHWRAFYRVPLKSPEERLALSVTARNSINKWRRVWIFLPVRLEALEEQTEPAPQP